MRRISRRNVIFLCLKNTNRIDTFSASYRDGFVVIHLPSTQLTSMEKVKHSFHFFSGGGEGGMMLLYLCRASRVSMLVVV